VRGDVVQRVWEPEWECGAMNVGLMLSAEHNPVRLTTTHVAGMFGPYNGRVVGLHSTECEKKLTIGSCMRVVSNTPEPLQNITLSDHNSHITMALTALDVLELYTELGNILKKVSNHKIPKA
jgi:hypothetical protein